MNRTVNDSVGLYFYRVQEAKPVWRRKWQVEWDSCYFAQRGYTRRGAAAMAALRRSHPRFDGAYYRLRIIIRWVDGYDHGWYRERYTITGQRVNP
jgi:hypothetical protein